MTLQVIGAGFGRTGTLSTKMALETLGIGPCYHMKELYGHPEHLPLWQRASRGEAADWETVFGEFKATVDWPATAMWADLVEHYPDARVVVNVRPVEAWADSMQQTVCKLLAVRKRHPDSYVRDVLEVAYRLIAEQAFGGRLDDRQALISAFEAHTDTLKRSLPPERVLFFDVSDGWPPLCEFLALEIPDTPFPRSNSRDEFWDIFGRDLSR